MIKYPHPLDYATGLKYALTSKKLNILFEASSSSFHVEELVDFDKLGFNVEKGDYAVLRAVRREADTLKVIRLLERHLGVPLSNIHLFGLKDKNALAVSYFFVKSSLVDKAVFPIATKNVTIELIGYVKCKPRRVHHLGNKFTVYIKDATREDIDVLKEIVDLILKVGLPSYYGYQRFGYSRYNTHLLGKYMLVKREDLFARDFLVSLYPLESDDVLVKRVKLDFDTLWYEQRYVSSPLRAGLKLISRYTRSIFIHAYGSYLFNMLINELVDSFGIEFLQNKSLPLPGCTESYTYYESIVKKEGLTMEMLKYMPCYKRPALFKPHGNTIEVQGDEVVYKFTLDPGMYATVVLRELFKENLVIRS
ncbi:MAG: tRNA pseudouridine(13) synthase TruD [Desulfurococcaceae archaeon]